MENEIQKGTVAIDNIANISHQKFWDDIRKECHSDSRDKRYDFVSSTEAAIALGGLFAVAGPAGITGGMLMGMTIGADMGRTDAKNAEEACMYQKVHDLAVSPEK
jgi:hypothetical protein